MPRTWWPSSARQAATVAPTCPQPTTVMRSPAAQGVAADMPSVLSPCPASVVRRGRFGGNTHLWRSGSCERRSGGAGGELPFGGRDAAVELLARWHETL